MALVITPEEDSQAFANIISITKSDFTAVQINNNTLFKLAEQYIVDKITAAALPTGRTHAERSKIVEACVSLGSAYILNGGGLSTGASSEQVERKSVTMGPVRTETTYAQRSRQSGSQTPADWLEEKALQIIESIIGESAGESGSLSVNIRTTKSKLD